MTPYFEYRVYYNIESLRHCKHRISTERHESLVNTTKNEKIKSNFLIFYWWDGDQWFSIILFCVIAHTKLTLLYLQFSILRVSKAGMRGWLKALLLIRKIIKFVFITTVQYRAKITKKTFRISPRYENKIYSKWNDGKWQTAKLKQLTFFIVLWIMLDDRHKWDENIRLQSLQFDDWWDVSKKYKIGLSVFCFSNNGNTSHSMLRVSHV